MIIMLLVHSSPLEACERTYSWIWWHMPAIPVLRIEVSLGYTMRHCVKTQRTKQSKTKGCELALSYPVTKSHMCLLTSGVQLSLLRCSMTAK